MGRKELLEDLKDITPEWAWLKDINEARKEGRVFDSKEELVSKINNSNEEVVGKYYCPNCNVYVIGLSKHPDYFNGKNESHMSSYEIMKGVRAFAGPGLCEFCNHHTNPVTL